MTFTMTSPATVGEGTKKSDLDAILENTIELQSGIVARDKETLDGVATADAPSVSPAGKLRWYYDTDLNQIMVSKNGAAYAPFGALLQAPVLATTLTEDSTTSGTYADTSLSQSFTPVSSLSTIVVIGQHAGVIIGTGNTASIRLMRDATELDEFMAAKGPDGSGGLGAFAYVESSPGTSAVVYGTEFRRDSGSNTTYLQRNGDHRSWMLIFEVTP